MGSGKGPRELLTPSPFLMRLSNRSNATGAKIAQVTSSQAWRDDSIEDRPKARRGDRSHPMNASHQRVAVRLRYAYDALTVRGQSD